MKVDIYIVPVTIHGQSDGGPRKVKARYAVIGINHEDVLARLRARMAGTWEAVFATAIRIEYGTPYFGGEVIEISEHA